MTTIHVHGPTTITEQEFHDFLCEYSYGDLSSIPELVTRIKSKWIDQFNSGAPSRSFRDTQLPLRRPADLTPVITERLGVYAIIVEPPVIPIGEQKVRVVGLPNDIADYEAIHTMLSQKASSRLGSSVGFSSNPYIVFYVGQSNNDIAHRVFRVHLNSDIDGRDARYKFEFNWLRLCPAIHICHAPIRPSVTSLVNSRSLEILESCLTSELRPFFHTLNALKP